MSEEPTGKERLLNWRKYYSHAGHRRIACEIVKDHWDRKNRIRRYKERIDEIRGDIIQPRIDGMPHSKRPYTDRIGERVAMMIDTYQRYIDRNQEYCDIVDASFGQVCKNRKITPSMISEYGDKAQVLYWARKCIEISIISGDASIIEDKWPWGEGTWHKERKAFLDRISEWLCLDAGPKD